MPSHLTNVFVPEAMSNDVCDWDICFPHDAPSQPAYLESNIVSLVTGFTAIASIAAQWIRKHQIIFGS
jgi:hypothetical protein